MLSQRVGIVKVWLVLSSGGFTSPDLRARKSFALVILLRDFYPHSARSHLCPREVAVSIERTESKSQTNAIPTFVGTSYGV